MNNPPSTSPRQQARPAERWLALGLSIFAFALFFWSTKATQQPFDYTARIAGALLQGKVGLTSKPPSWLNEMVPMNGEFYSVFPLGAVLTMLPVAVLQNMNLLHHFPAHFIASLTAAGCVFFFFRLSAVGPGSLVRRAMLALFPVFGTWTWCNVAFGGAWQLALGFALVGETAALYYTVAKPQPLIAGACYGLACGNRTELTLIAPLFVYLWIRRSDTPPGWRQWWPALIAQRRALALFLVAPVALGLATVAYNFARFGSPLDFGYARIPGVLNEPWYHGRLFSFTAIPWNMYKMLFAGVEDIPDFPYIRPFPFGCSIFLSSPFLFLLFREGGKVRGVCWLAIGILTFVLWCHGNPGGWQFSYRYGMILLPWMFLLILGNGPAKLSVTELALFLVSVAVNVVAMYQFIWTDQIHP